MKSELTKIEKYQFSLCESTAKSVQSQRAAIQREGLHGLSRAEIRKQQLACWKAFKSQHAAGVPAWVVAARFLAAGTDWRHATCPTAAGHAIGVQRLRSLAFHAAPWGRSRKRGCGLATLSHCRVLESDNGKTGWNRVVSREADYISVISPARDQIYYQFDRDAKPRVSRVLRNYFLLDGVRTEVSSRSTYGWSPTLRSTAQRLRLAGIDARLVRQTRDQIELGSGESSRSYVATSVQCVVPCGDGSFYHADLGQSVERVRDAIERRVRLSANRPIKNPERVWVSFADSIASGNCVAGTRSCADSLSRLLKATGELGAVRADWLLARRNDDFTRRACVAAAARC